MLIFNLINIFVGSLGIGEENAALNSRDWVLYSSKKLTVIKNCFLNMLTFN